MKAWFSNLTAVLAAAVFVGPAAVPALGADNPVPHAPPGGDITNMATFYTGTNAKAGNFKGKLICLRTGREYAPETASKCSGSDHIYALSMADGTIVRPVLAATKTAERDLRHLLEKSVQLNGKYYPNTGVIVAGAVSKAQ